MTSQHTQRGERESSTQTRSDRATGGTDTRRAVMAVGGGVLLLYGIARRSVRGVLAVVAGGWLLRRALRGGTPSQGSGNWSGSAASATKGAPRTALDVQRSITIERAPEELYEQWREPEAHERLWAHFAEVEQTGEDRQHWEITGPRSVSLEWDAEIVAADPGEFLRWKSLPGAQVPNEGSVRFLERGDGEETEVTLHLRFDPPGGRVGTAVMERLDLVPNAAVGKALRRFKSLVETGEMPTLEGNPSARGSGDPP
ncbi:hypothetical protein BRC79_09745 [Halobacteriales archaeon QH_8_67_27]|nr:MAG: hypothetical protein BRC79_09745 [Halobacteriales archaeon QH_8_67_27]